MLKLTALIMLAMLVAGSAFAAGCDLDEVIGYQLVSSLTIQGYIDAGKQYLGFDGCAPGRVIMFTDHTGVRCKNTGRQHLELPKAYLFAHSRYELKLCVGDTFYDVAPMR